MTKEKSDEKLRLYKVRYGTKYGSIEEACNKSELKEKVKDIKAKGGKIYKIWNRVTGKVYFQKRAALKRRNAK